MLSVAFQEHLRSAPLLVSLGAEGRVVGHALADGSQAWAFDASTARVRPERLFASDVPALLLLETPPGAPHAVHVRPALSRRAPQRRGCARPGEPRSARDARAARSAEA